MKVIIYGLRNCDTCRKAKKALPEADLVDVRDQGFPEGLLEKAREDFGDQLLNRRSTTWKGLSESERQGDPLELIRKHPTLMKRPVIQIGDVLFLNWSKDIEAEVKAIL